MVIEVARREKLLRTLSDPKSDTVSRVEAASALAECLDDKVIDALVALAEDAQAAVDLQVATGRSLARGIVGSGR